MESFAHALHQLQSGALPHPEFFTQLDRVLERAPESAGRLLELLSEEHARQPLPGEVYSEVQQRIGRLIAARQRLGADDTFVQTRPGAQAASPAPPASSAPSAPSGPAVPPPLAARAQDDGAGASAERMKGVGETLNGRFVLEECIGFGGMGTVYKALDLRKLEASDRKPYIAIKVLNVQFRGHPKSLIALQREARKAQALAHPNIVSVYDFDRDGPMVYLTMEYLQGRPLSQVLRAPGFAGLPYADVLRIATGMANALSYAHGRGFVHCDFKPGNVILTDTGNVKVIDFGIARLFQKSEEDVDVTVFDPGSLGALTPAYASPEMLERREPDPRDDIYALACICYELLTGRHPFNRVSSAQARSSGMKPQRPAGLGRTPWHALRCGLALERDARTPTVARFIAGFGARGAVSRLGMAGAAIAAVLAAGALGTAGWYYLGRSAPPPGAVAPPPAAATRQPAAGESTAGESAAPAPAVPPAPPTPAALAAVLARIPCSALVGAVRGDVVEVQGFLSAAADGAGVRNALLGMPGVSAVELDVGGVDPRMCPVLATFAPYWAAHRQAGGGAALRLAGTRRGAGATLREGDSLMVEATAPAGESFMTVDAYAPDASVIHLLPNALALENRVRSNGPVAIGRPGDWRIGQQAGTGLLAVLVTTPAPLFGTLRRESEPSAEYLASVAQSLARIRAQGGMGEGGGIGVEFLPIAVRTRGN